MNIDLCKKCHLYPYIFKLENFYQGKNMLIVCTEPFNSMALNVAELNNNEFNKIIDYLIENDYYEKYDTVKSEMISLQDKVGDSGILKDIDINQNCPYYFEHEMDRLNE